MTDQQATTYCPWCHATATRCHQLQATTDAGHTCCEDCAGPGEHPVRSTGEEGVGALGVL